MVHVGKYTVRPMDCLGFILRQTNANHQVTFLPPNVNKLQGTNCSCWMSIASGGWIADIFVLHLPAANDVGTLWSHVLAPFFRKGKSLQLQRLFLVAKIQHKLGGIEATIVWMFFGKHWKEERHQTWDDNWRSQIGCISVYLLTCFEVKKVEHLWVSSRNLWKKHRKHLRQFKSCDLSSRT